jgi:hypothetical protein
MPASRTTIASGSGPSPTPQQHTGLVIHRRRHAHRCRAIRPMQRGVRGLALRDEPAVAERGDRRSRPHRCRGPAAQHDLVVDLDPHITTSATAVVMAGRSSPRCGPRPVYQRQPAQHDVTSSTTTLATAARIHQTRVDTTRLCVTVRQRGGHRSSCEHADEHCTTLQYGRDCDSSSAWLSSAYAARGARRRAMADAR